MGKEGHTPEEYTSGEMHNVSMLQLHALLWLTEYAWTGERRTLDRANAVGEVMKG